MILMTSWIFVVPLMGQASAQVKSAKWQDISPQVLAEKLRQDQPLLLLDIRDRTHYEITSLPGAVFAGSDPRGYLPNAKGGEVVLVTTSPPQQQQLQQWSARLIDFHFQVFVLKGGIQLWQQQGRPVMHRLQSYVIPGTVPFVIPRGLCESNKPAQEFH